MHQPGTSTSVLGITHVSLWSLPTSPSTKVSELVAALKTFLEDPAITSFAMDATDSPRQELRVAKLVVVDYEKIRQRDEVESAKLYTACVDWGFFYLDLSSSPSQPFLKTVEKLFGVSNQYFSKSFAEKLKDTREDMDVFNICGYKTSRSHAQN